MKNVMAVCALGAVLWGSAAGAEDRDSSSLAPSLEALSVTGFSRRIEQIPVIAEALWSEQGEVLSQESFDSVGEFFLGVYRLDALMEGVARKVQENADAETLRRILAAYEDPLIRRVVAQEEAATTLEGLVGIQEFAEGLDQSRLSGERSDLMERVEAALGTTELVAEATVILFRTMAEVGNAVAPRGEAREAEEVENRLDEMRGQLFGQLRMVHFIQHLYTYRGVSEIDLDLYLRLREGEDGSWLREAARDALIETLEEGARAFSRHLEEMAPELAAAAAVDPSRPTPDTLPGPDPNP